MEARLETVAGIDEGGRLFVQGPNVMLGYLRAEKPGVLEPPAEGWHDTGDIVTIDEDGFITIKGRAKRFAKLGGEMVSLAAVESLPPNCGRPRCRLRGRPGSAQGRAAILVTQKHDATRADFQAFARSHAAELMMPAEVVIVDRLPLLGTGKVDNMGVTKMVRELAAAKSSAAEECA